jgi:hypothetical protein
MYRTMNIRTMSIRTISIFSTRYSEKGVGHTLRPYILCIIGAVNQIQTPTSSSPTLTIQLIEYTCCHDRFPDQALQQKHTKYNPLINTIQNNRWKINPLITITTGVKGAIYEHSIKKLTNLTSQNEVLKPS